MKRIAILALLSSLSLISNAQYGSAINLGTALSETSLQGTARYVGSGGIMGSVGGDISNLSTNPAGLGMFSKSEFEISPSLQLNNVNTNYQYLLGNVTKGSSVLDNSQVRFTLNSMGVVIANRRSEKESLRASNVTIGINRTANFNRTIDFTSQNSVYSYSNYLSDGATYYNTPNPVFIDDYLPLQNDLNRTLISKEAQLSLYDNSAGYYIDPVPYKSGTVIQSGSKKITGGITEFSVAWSGNIKDKFFIGTSMGIPFLSHRSELLLSEDNTGATFASPTGFGAYKFMDLMENDYFSGVGINLKLGGLYKVNENLKLSGYIHTPTYYNISNNYAVGMTTSYANSNNSASREVAEFTFNYISPFKGGLGISYLFGKTGFIGAEYEFTNNMSTSIIIDNAFWKSTINQTLHNEQLNTHKLKIGGELAIDIFRLRAGYNHTTGSVNPSYQFRGINKATQVFSGGIGIRGKSSSLDLAFVRNEFQDFSEIYRIGNESFGIINKTSQNQIIATFNYRFR